MNDDDPFESSVTVLSHHKYYRYHRNNNGTATTTANVSLNIIRWMASVHDYLLPAMISHGQGRNVFELLVFDSLERDCK